MASSPRARSRGLPLAKLDVGKDFLEACAREAGSEPDRLESLALPRAGLRSIAADAWAPFSSLRVLNLARNGLSSVRGVECLVSLEELSLYFNRLGCILDCATPLRSLRRLRVLDVRMNPLTREESYRERLLATLPKLERLDSRIVTTAELSPPPDGEDLLRQLEAAVGGEESPVEHLENVDDENGHPETGETAEASQECGIDAEKAGENGFDESPNVAKEVKTMKTDLSHALGIMSQFLADAERSREEERRRNRLILRSLQDAQDALLKSNDALRRELDGWRDRYEREAAAWKQNFDELKQLYQEVAGR